MLFRSVTFGHLGDGNLHYNVSAPLGSNEDDFLEDQKAINHLVHESVARFNGSISAEHGIGTLKRDEMVMYKSEVELKLMRQIKNALDPHNLMNPGKIL